MIGRFHVNLPGCTYTMQSPIGHHKFKQNFPPCNFKKDLPRYLLTHGFPSEFFRNYSKSILISKKTGSPFLLLKFHRKSQVFQKQGKKNGGSQSKSARNPAIIARKQTFNVSIPNKKTVEFVGWSIHGCPIQPR